MRFKKIYIEILNSCNLRCSFCIQNHREIKMMTIAQFTHIINEIKPYTKYVYLHVLGEPLLHPQLKEILEICHRNKLHVNITTNGTLLKKQLSILLSNPVRQINISLHNFKEQDGINMRTYIEDLVCCVKELAEHDVFVSYRLWNMKNAMLDEDTLQILHILLEQYGITLQDKIEAQKNITLSRNVFVNFEEIFQWPNLQNSFVSDTGTCLGLINMCAILSDGTITPCCLDSEGNCKLGNIFEESFSDILEFDKTKEILHGFLDHKVMAELCKKCTYRLRFD